MLDATHDCPRFNQQADSGQCLDLDHAFINGHLAVAGGAMDQPAIYMQAMRCIASAMRIQNDR